MGELFKNFPNSSSLLMCVLGASDHHGGCHLAAPPERDPGARYTTGDTNAR
jgi:hypothetical protein